MAVACLRGISKRVILLQRRVFPTCGHLLGEDEDKIKPASQDTMIHKVLACNGSNKLSPMFVERHYQLFVGPLGLGFSSCRYMSSTPPEWSDKVGGTDFVAAEVVPDSVIEAVTIADISLDISAIVTTGHAVSAVNEVAIAAADSAFPVAALQHLIDAVHSFTGLNWWASIALTTVIIRGVTFLLRLNQLKATYRLFLLHPQMKELVRGMITKAQDPETMTEGERRMLLFIKEHGGTQFKGFIIDGFIFISFFFAIRNMAEKVPSFKTGGTLWFTDLTIADTTYILPFLTAMTYLIKSNVKEGPESFPLLGILKKSSRISAFLSIPFLIVFENALVCHWLTSSLCNHVCRLAMQRPLVMRLLKLYIFSTRQPEPKDQSVAQEKPPTSSSNSSSSVPDRCSVQRTRKNKK